MSNRYELDTIIPCVAGDSESYRIYDKYQGKYIGEHYFDWSTAWNDLDIMNEGEELENYHEFG